MPTLHAHGPEITAGKVIAFLPCKGGAGATFIAANVAHALSLAGHATCLLDLNLPFGEAALYLTERQPERSIADLAGQHARLDGALLESCLTPIGKNFSLLAAPEAPERALGVGPQDVAALLEVARQQFDCVVLDLNRSIDDQLLRALDCADEIHLVFQPSLAAVRNARRLLGLMAGLSYPAAQTHLFLNRHQKGSGLQLAEIEKALGQRIAHVLPNRFGTATAAVDQGRPVLELAPADPLARSLRDLARSIAGTAESNGPPLPWWRLARRTA